MNASLRKPQWTKTEDVAGRHATTLGDARAMAFEPAANEVAARDYTAEANDARALVESYVERRLIPSEPPTTESDLDRNTGPADETVVQLLAAPIISIARDPQQAYFISTQEWDGYVTSVGREAFEATIYPVGTSEEFREDTVTVPLWLVDAVAQHRVKPGAIFRLATGRQLRKRQISHGAKVYFRLAADVRKQVGLDRGALEAFFDD